MKDWEIGISFEEAPVVALPGHELGKWRGKVGAK